MSGPIAILHLDESCLGNGREGENPGGGAALIEVRSRSGRIERRDFYVHETATTNNRMALLGAARVLDLLARKGGPIENLELWKALDRASRGHEVQWTWLRGHRRHPKNEYADWLAVRAARERRSTDGAVESEFAGWLAMEQEKGLYAGYDPDAGFTALEKRVAAGEHFPLVLVE